MVRGSVLITREHSPRLIRVEQFITICPVHIDKNMTEVLLGDEKVVQFDHLVKEMTETIELAIADGEPLEKKTITRLMDMVIESNYLELLTKEEYVSISELERMATDLADGTEHAEPVQQEYFVNTLNLLLGMARDSLLK